MMTLTARQVFVAILLTVMGVVLQYYMDGLPVGKIAFAVGLLWFLYNASKGYTGYIEVPFTQLNQATKPEQLPFFTISLYTNNPSLALFVMMGIMLPTLWLGVFVLLKAINQWHGFLLFISLLVLGFSWLSVLAMLSEMHKDTTPTHHGSLTLTPQFFQIDFRGQHYHLNWYQLRDIVASDGEGNSKKVILVMSIAGELQELYIHQSDINVETRKLTTFLQHYRIKAQGRQIPVIT